MPPGAHISDAARARRDVDARELQRAREDTGRTYDDLVQMLREARFEDTGERLTPDDLLDEALTFYVAGHETSSHALAWFVYETGQRPDLRRELREEVRRASGDRDASLEALAGMPLLLSTLKAAVVKIKAKALFGKTSASATVNTK